MIAYLCVREVRNALITVVFCLSPSLALAFGSELHHCETQWSEVELQSPTVVTTCTGAGIQEALNNGGHITFDCGADPVTIPIYTVLHFNSGVDTILDGGGLVTLDGQNSTRLFYKGWDGSGTEDITITLQNIRVINGRAPSGTEHSGGVFYGGYQGFRLHIFNSDFENNSTTEIHTTDNQGGAIFVHNAYETVIAGSRFVNNRAGNGGAYGAIGSDLYIFNSIFSSNEAADDSDGGIVRGHGGAIHLDGAGRGDDRATDNRVQVCGSYFENNRAVRGGGALKVTISDNRNILASYVKSTFIGNSSSGASEIEGHGGAIYHIEDDNAGATEEDNVELVDCFFQNNSGWRQGGGAWFAVYGKMDIFNNTFVDNSVTAMDYGMGGALVTSRGEADVVNNTFVRNFASFHGGAIQSSSNTVLMLKNNLFHYNESTREWACYQLNLTSGADIDGGGNIQYPQTRYNQSGDVQDCLVSNSAIFVNAEILDPIDNGGPTLTMALPGGSQAVNTGTNIGAPAKDQRGFIRDENCDVGAYEYGALPQIGLEDIILSLRICTGMDVDIASMSMLDVNGDTRIGIEEAIAGMRILAEDDIGN